VKFIAVCDGEGDPGRSPALQEFTEVMEKSRYSSLNYIPEEEE